MKRFLKLFRHGQKGFTLIELLIVVGILGILVAVAIPNIVKFMGAGSVGAANAELRMVNTAVDATMADAGVAALDAQIAAWDGTGPSGAPTATVSGTAYTADAYLTLKGATLKGTYLVETTGEVEGVEYTGLEWDDVNFKWKLEE